LGATGPLLRFAHCDSDVTGGEGARSSSDASAPCASDEPLASFEKRVWEMGASPPNRYAARWARLFPGRGAPKTNGARRVVRGGVRRAGCGRRASASGSAEAADKRLGWSLDARDGRSNQGDAWRRCGSRRWPSTLPRPGPRFPVDQVPERGDDRGDQGQPIPPLVGDQHPPMVGLAIAHCVSPEGGSRW
jgi:hypothetical protein